MVYVGQQLFGELVDGWLEANAAKILLDRAAKFSQREKKEEKTLPLQRKGCLVNSNSNRNNLKTTRK